MTDVVVAIGDVLAIAMSNVEAIYVVINAGVVAIVVVELLEFLKCGL